MPEKPVVQVPLNVKWFKDQKKRKVVLALRADLQILVQKDSDPGKPSALLARLDTATDVTTIPREILKKAGIAAGTPVLTLNVSTAAGEYKSDVFKGRLMLAALPTIRIDTHFGCLPPEAVSRRFWDRWFNWRPGAESDARHGLISLADLLKRFDVCFVFKQGTRYMELRPR